MHSLYECPLSEHEAQNTFHVPYILQLVAIWATDVNFFVQQLNRFTHPVKKNREAQSQ
jgi:hypothetical protein